MKSNTLFILIVFLICILIPRWSTCQQKSVAVKTTESINKKTKEIQEDTHEIGKQVKQASANVQNTVEEIQSIAEVLEPIFKFRLKKKKSIETSSINDPSKSQLNKNTDNSKMDLNKDTETNEPASKQLVPEEFEPESIAYNKDGTANLGNQNNKEFGCYLNIIEGLIMDDVDVIDKTDQVDLIYTATNHYGAEPMYALLTPAYAKREFTANYYFRGTTYKDHNIPVKLWDKLNDSEIALTNLTSVRFEKLKQPQQLISLVKQTPGFKELYFTRVKLTGQVFAIKTEMNNRRVYGLMHVVDHLGTTGENGYLKVKIKLAYEPI